MPRLLLLILLLMSTRVDAQPRDFFNNSPGALSQSHASIDDPAHCNDCHVNGTRDIAKDRCLGCHDHQDLATNIKAGKGYHASQGVAGKSCGTCHKEHKKRDFDIMGWNAVGGEKAFNHKTTGWPLNGKHLTTDCARCHKAKNTQGLKVYMGTKNLCGSVGCHANDQPHKFERKDMECDRCHTESVWKQWKQKSARFDHDDKKDSAMPLLGAHKPLINNCAKCHPKAVFNLPFADPDSCGNAGCHQSPHTGHLFDKRDCEWCHSPTFAKLKDTKFDHDLRTKFDLGPRHKKLNCYDCHTKARGEQKPAGTCVECHAKDNRHGGRFKQFGDPAPACQVCHPSGGNTFKSLIFDHGRSAKWPLQAKHAKVPSCRGCHRGQGPADFERFENGGGACKNCHQHKTVHASPKFPAGRWNNDKCIKCHARPGDKTLRAPKELEKEFHGPTSDFPLLKKHKGLACDLCHKNIPGRRAGTTFEEESAECGDRCHEDFHKGTLGKLCSPCHESGTWDAGKFDHDKPFPDGGSYLLIGEHRKLDCEQCHTPAKTFKDTPNNCSAAQCHQDDDAHKGRLGTACEKCHAPTGDVLFNHNTMSKFRLDGKHLAVRCTDCHPSPTFKPRPSTCFGCHPDPAIHKGQYGTQCEQCHTTRTWDDVKPLHDVGDFALKGSHNNIACERCHRDNRPLSGAGNLCINCHRQDDIHNNSLSPRCGECHTQWSFVPARFDHGRVGCNLTGLHRTQACFDCHKSGNISGLSAQCASCHHDDALRVGMRGTNHPAEQTCARCHNPNAWLPADIMGTFAFNRESVCR